MAQPLSLMEFLQALRADAGLRSSFGNDPEGTLTDHGLADLSPADVHDAIVLVQDTQTIDFGLDAPGAGAQPPPVPAGDGHEAAVEYLARYLGYPSAGSPAGDAWDGADPEANVAAAPGAHESADAGDFGAGAHGTPDDHAGPGPGTDVAESVTFDEISDSGFDEHEAEAGDLSLDDDLNEPDPSDPGADFSA
jgi:hypothetical protein